jgi:hypothetical protein
MAHLFLVQEPFSNDEVEKEYEASHDLADIVKRLNFGKV